MKYNWSLLAVLTILFIGCTNNPDDDGDNQDYEGYTLIWSDEFNESINPLNWNFELGNGTAYGLPAGWGNNEKQLYSDSGNNALIKPDGDGNSVLAIVAKEEPGDNYSSAKLTTQGLQSFRFGRIEARVKVPSGQGLWPAFWLLGENITEVDWPGCGEIDVFEVIGHQTEVVHCSGHFANGENKLESQTNELNVGEDLSADYHIYRLDWRPNAFTLSIDDQVVNEILIEDDMKEFERSMYIIFNVAVGGNWPGDPDASTSFPQEMHIDWVRAYSEDGLTLPDEPALNIQEETIGVLANDIAIQAFNTALNPFDQIGLKAFGAGGEPSISTSDLAVEGDSSLVFSYPGGNWGGGFFELDPTIDGNQFANTELVFSLNTPEDLHDIEIKLESVSSAHSVFLIDYPGMEVENGFMEYRIPISDFTDLSLDDFKIPFALWNPVDTNGEYIVGDIYVDNIYFE